MAAHQNKSNITTKITDIISNKTTLLTLSSVLIIYFIFWLITTILPVTIVEAKYRYKNVLVSTFGTDNLIGAMLPNFEGLNTYGSGKYKDYGIVIPAVFIDEPVVFNVDPNNKKSYTEALNKGIAHASGTAFPDNGNIGYYFAHSSSPELRTQYNAVFYLLGKLKKDDDIFVWHEGKKNRYLVTDIMITSPQDVSFLQKEYSNETIVLQTCWPPGTTNKRLLVFGERVE